jgi:hypothetical protein
MSVHIRNRPRTRRRPRPRSGLGRVIGNAHCTLPLALPFFGFPISTQGLWSCHASRRSREPPPFRMLLAGLGLRRTLLRWRDTLQSGSPPGAGYPYVRPAIATDRGRGRRRVRERFCEPRRLAPGSSPTPA